MKKYSLPLVIIGTVLSLILASCSPTTRTSAPAVNDIYWPYRGVDASVSIACGANDALFAYDADAPLNILEGESEHRQGVTVTELSYASPMGGRVPATLVIPDGEGPFAGMILQHGMGAGSHAGGRFTLLPGAESYARLGAVVILIDAPWNRPEHGSYASMSLSEKDRLEQIQYVIDLRRAVDLLLARPDVDPQRLAYEGHSGGGAIGGLLAGIEDRLKGYVLVVGDGGLVTHLTGPEDFMWWDYKPKGLREKWIAWMWPIEPVHYVGCAAPAALLFQNGTHDNSVPPPDAMRYQQAGSEPKTIQWYEGGHNGLGNDAFLDRADWLKDLIGIDRYRGSPLGVEIALISWLLLTIISLAWIAWDVWRARPAPYGARLLWLVATIILGPLALAAYWLSGRQPVETGGTAGPVSPARGAFGAAVWAASGNLLGIIVALVILFSIQAEIPVAVVLVLVTVLPFCTGWLINVVARWISRSDVRFQAYSFPVLAQMTSTCLVITGGYTTFFLLQRCLVTWAGPVFFGLSYPPLWGGMVLVAAAGVLVAYPYHLWMIRKGVIGWSGIAPSVEDPVRGFPPIRQAALLLLAIAAVLGILFLGVQLG